MKRYALILSFLLLFSFVPAFAANPTAIVPDSGTEPGDYTFQLYSPDTYIDFAENFYADEIFIHADHANFTNIALGAASNPTQTFGLGIESGNITITDIESTYVKITTDCDSECDSKFYYDDVIVSGVDVSVAGEVTSFVEGSYHADESEFNSADAPAVLRTNEYIEVKAASATITFYLAPTGPSGGGGGGGTTTQPPSTGSAGPLNVTLPVFQGRPGVPVTHDLTVQWSGSWFATLDSITFSEHPEWFTIGRPLPFSSSVAIEPGRVGSMSVIFAVPITMTIPPEADCISQDIDVEVTAGNGISSSTARVTLQVQCDQGIEMWMIFAGAGAGIVGVAIVVKRRR